MMEKIVLDMKREKHMMPIHINKLIKYLDQQNRIKYIVEKNYDYFIADCNIENLEKVAWHRAGLTAILIILDQDAKNIIEIEQWLLYSLKEELIEIGDNQLNNAERILVDR